MQGLIFALSGRNHIPYGL